MHEKAMESAASLVVEEDVAANHARAISPNEAPRDFASRERRDVRLSADSAVPAKNLSFCFVIGRVGISLCHEAIGAVAAAFLATASAPEEEVAA